MPANNTVSSAGNSN